MHMGWAPAALRWLGGVMAGLAGLAGWGGWLGWLGWLGGVVYVGLYFACDYL